MSYSKFLSLAFIFWTLFLKAQQPATSAETIKNALEQKRAMTQTSLVKNVPFKNIGPTIMSGRVVDLDVNPNMPSEFYVGYASGGVWHTTNNGTTFTPILDSSDTQNVGDIAVHWPSRTIYVGTGENNASRSSYAGIGLLKSTDNGDTWTKTTFLDFPVDKYAMDDGLDLDSDGTMDQVYSSDNYGAVVLDANGQAHVFYGIMMYVDDDLTDASSSWVPAVNGIAYWNESFGADTTPAYMHPGDSSLWYSDMMNNHWILAAPDLNGDSMVAGVDSTGGYALYYASRASMPNAGISANGEIYLSFSGYTETADNGTQVFRHVYITKSSDGGATWKDPVDVTPHTAWNGAQECVFASMNPVVDDKIRIVYQKDFEPGLAVRGDEDMVDNNDIIYLEIDTVGLFDAPLAIAEANSSTHFSVYPNPATSFTNLKISSDKTQTMKISIVDLLGKEITKKEKLIVSGINNEKINISKYQNGIYFINLQAGNKLTTKKSKI